MTMHLEFTWSDLTFEAQEASITTVLPQYLEKAEEQGKDLLNLEWHSPKPESWQEAYCRMFAINRIMWTDYENQEEGHDKPQLADWNEWLKDHLREMIEVKISIGLKRTEVEVEV